MKNRIRIVRQPWTADINDMLESRVYELYLNQVFPLVEVDYVGGDFSLSHDLDQSEIRNVMLFGNLKTSLVIVVAAVAAAAVVVVIVVSSCVVCDGVNLGLRLGDVILVLTIVVIEVAVLVLVAVLDPIND